MQQGADIKVIKNEGKAPKTAVFNFQGEFKGHIETNDDLARTKIIVEKGELAHFQAIYSAITASFI